jgi:hypothetical protein
MNNNKKKKPHIFRGNGYWPRILKSANLLDTCGCNDKKLGAQKNAGNKICFCIPSGKAT